MLIPAKDILVGDILVHDEFFRDRVDDVSMNALGHVKVILNDDTATMFFNPNDIVLVARPKTVVNF